MWGRPLPARHTQPAQGQLLSGWRFCDSACLVFFPQEICPLLGLAAKALGSWDSTPGSGQGCCGQLCSLGTAQTAGPRGRRGLDSCSKLWPRLGGVPFPNFHRGPPCAGSDPEPSEEGERRGEDTILKEGVGLSLLRHWFRCVCPGTWGELGPVVRVSRAHQLLAWIPVSGLGALEGCGISHLLRSVCGAPEGGWGLGVRPQDQERARSYATPSLGLDHLGALSLKGSFRHPGPVWLWSWQPSSKASPPEGMCSGDKGAGPSCSVLRGFLLLWSPTPRTPSVPRCSSVGRASPPGSPRVVSGWEGRVGSPAPSRPPGKSCVTWQHCSAPALPPPAPGQGLGWDCHCYL